VRGGARDSGQGLFFSHAAEGEFGGFRAESQFIGGIRGQVGPIIQRENFYLFDLNHKPFGVTAPRKSDIRHSMMQRRRQGEVAKKPEGLVGSL